MILSKSKDKRRKRIHRKIRKRIRGIKNCPRFGVFRSLKHIYAFLIDDENGKTIISVHEKEIKGASKMSKKEKVEAIGKLIAKKSLAKKIEKVVFDRSGYKYHGQVKLLAESARKAGLKF